YSHFAVILQPYCLEGTPRASARPATTRTRAAAEPFRARSAAQAPSAPRTASHLQITCPTHATAVSLAEPTQMPFGTLPQQKFAATSLPTLPAVYPLTRTIKTTKNHYSLRPSASPLKLTPLSLFLSRLEILNSQVHIRKCA